MLIANAGKNQNKRTQLWPHHRPRDRLHWQHFGLGARRRPQSHRNGVHLKSHRVCRKRFIRAVGPTHSMRESEASFCRHEFGGRPCAADTLLRSRKRHGVLLEAEEERVHHGRPFALFEQRSAWRVLEADPVHSVLERGDGGEPPRRVLGRAFAVRLWAVAEHVAHPRLLCQARAQLHPHAHAAPQPRLWTPRRRRVAHESHSRHLQRKLGKGDRQLRRRHVGVLLLQPAGDYGEEACQHGQDEHVLQRNGAVREVAPQGSGAVGHFGVGQAELRRLALSGNDRQSAEQELQVLRAPADGTRAGRLRRVSPCTLAACAETAAGSQGGHERSHRAENGRHFSGVWAKGNHADPNKAAAAAKGISCLLSMSACCTDVYTKIVTQYFDIFIKRKKKKRKERILNLNIHFFILLHSSDVFALLFQTITF